MRRVRAWRCPPESRDTFFPETMLQSHAEFGDPVRQFASRPGRDGDAEASRPLSGSQGRGCPGASSRQPSPRGDSGEPGLRSVPGPIRDLLCQSRPSTMTEPERRETVPAIALRSVLLPAPLEPMIERVCPLGTLSDNAERTTLSSPPPWGKATVADSTRITPFLPSKRQSPPLAWGVSPRIWRALSPLR